MPLSSKDYKKIFEIVEIAYSIPDRASMFVAVCEKLDKLIGFSSAVLLPIDPQTKKHVFPGPVVYNHTLSTACTWTLHYTHIDPLITEWNGQINNTVQNTDLVPASFLVDSEFGCDFLSPARCFHIIGAFLGSQGDEVALTGFHRQKHDRRFSDREKKLTDILILHISRALHNMDLMDTIASSLEIGMIIIREDGRIISINEEARSILNGKPPSVIPDPDFSTCSVFFKSETGTYNVRTIKKGKGRKEKIILLEPLPSERSIRSKLTGFGLTPRQEEIAVLIVRGLSNREIAERLFISEQTVRDHIYDIFGKLQVRRRSELTAKVLGLRTEGH